MSIVDRVEQLGGRSPFLFALWLPAVARLVCRRPATFPAVDWRSTLSQARRRFFWGLRWGLAACLLLTPLLFCPSPQTRRSLYLQIGKPVWLGWGSPVLMAGLGMAFALTTRAKLRDTGSLQAFFPWEEGDYDLEERAKTDCLGLLLPLAVNGYALYNFNHPRRLSFLFHQRMNPDTIVSLGIFGLGIALFLHAIGFVPYERVPFLKYVLAAAGLALFLYGASWPPGVR